MKIENINLKKLNPSELITTNGGGIGLWLLGVVVVAIIDDPEGFLDGIESGYNDTDIY